ncbi:MAG TPA: reverse transcriptase domain-containing protein [Planctomycetota bacterium]|jgi:retron-type reverse transcriptase
MTDDPKAKLYHRVQNLPLGWVLARMRIHGFWPSDRELPEDPPSEVLERKQLETRLSGLQKQHAVLKDPEKALAEEHKRRMKESRERRAERKKQREEERKQRVAAWIAKRQATIVHQGEGVSAGIGKTGSDAARLTELGLPVIHDGVELAAAIGITLSKLRWLTFHRRGATLVHYHRYEIPKKSGGMRRISAPKPTLKRAQHWVLENVLDRIELAPQAHGFRTEHSILSNAQPHVGQSVVINLDLKDFFPSITFARIQGLLKTFGYCQQVASLLALLCTEPPRAIAKVKGQRYYVAVGDRMLPQGACTSPALTNIICRRMDRRLNGIATTLGFVYTRYADDLTFSGKDVSAVGQLLKAVRCFVTDEGFQENLAKARIMRRAGHQEVTGVTVNVRPKLSRKELRTLRAILHNAARHGLASQNRENHPDFAAYLAGRVGFACMVDPEHSFGWKAALKKALGQA